MIFLCKKRRSHGQRIYPDEVCSPRLSPIETFCGPSSSCRALNLNKTALAYTFPLQDSCRS
jgi:hypothetical protein